MDEQTTNESGGLVKIIASAIQIPGVKVNRENFLTMLRRGVIGVNKIGYVV